MLRTFRIVSLVLLLALLANSLPSARPALARSQAQPATLLPVAQPADPVRAPAQELAAQPIVDAHQPSLSLSIAVAPDPLTVGETATFTITVSNSASDPAEDLAVTLPVPEGAQPLSGSGAQGQGWRWQVGHLDAYASTSVTSALRLTHVPPGAALLMQAQASARGLALPVQEVGGAIISERSTGLARASFTPGASTELRSADSRVQVQFPARALGRPLTLRHTSLADKLAEPGASQDRIPPALAGRSRGLGVFFLNATDATGADVHQFGAPLTVSVRYTPEQLRVRGLSEGSLVLSWFDQTQQRWVPLPSTIDRATQTVRASVDHFTAFEISGDRSPSEAYIPSLQGFQTSLFTGAASYSYPIDVPAAAGGLKPALMLSYSSAATDGDHPRQKQQASWVGKGWSLDVGSVSRRKIVINSGTGAFSNTYSLVLDGRSFDLVQGAPLAGNTGADDPDPSHWDWKPTTETFDQVRAVANGVSWDRSSTPTGGITDDLLTDSPPTPNYGHGGIIDGVARTRQAWQLRTKDGTLYEFRGDLWWGWSKEYLCSALPYEFEAYKWLLTRVTDVHGNQITYNYRRQILTGEKNICGNPARLARVTVDRDAWLESITWGKNVNVAGSTDRYKVTFDAWARANDTQFEGADNQFGGTEGQPRETRRLGRITVWSNSAGTWEQMRGYNLLNNDYRLTADTSVCAVNCTDTTGSYSPDTTYPKLTLLGIIQVGKTDAITVPTTTFTYASTATQRGTAYEAAGGFNRLIGVDNGQGGTVSIQYQNLVAAYKSQPYYNLFYNRHRVTSRTLTDGRGNSYTWSYTYGQAAVNSLGGAGQPSARPNSAVLYLNKYLDSNDRRAWLAHKENSEFRGHNYVAETLPTGAQIQHWFFQGDAGMGDPGCTITTTGPTLTNDPCFVKTRDWEILKGREYQTYTLSAPAGAILSEVRRHWKVDFYDYSGRPQTGLWRSFSYESATEDLSWEGGSTPKVKTTKRYYAPTFSDLAINPTPLYYQSDGQQYGNLTRVEEYDGGVGATTPLRISEHYYITRRNDAQGIYIVDRQWAEQVRDDQRRSLALTQFFYDGANTTPMSVGTKGDLTRVSKYYDVPLATNARNITLHGQDSAYTYDTYGNRLTEKTYSVAGTRLFDGTSWTISALPADSAARITSTVYDNPATGVDEANSGLAIQVTQPPAQAGATPLVEAAGYDYRLGTMTSVTDANGNITSATYDGLGRLSTLVKPGDSAAYPTVRVFYDNYNAAGRSGQPFTFTIYQREVAGQSGERITQQYYDGMGRQIQTKTESSDGSAILVNAIVDTRYDGLGQATQTSQARYMAETSGSFFLYTPIPASGVNWTSTTYDGLGRPRQITQPDGTKTTLGYRLGSLGSVTSTTDANGHRTETEYDVFGRRRTVKEYKGTGGVGDFYSVDATTSYGYSPLDLLTSVTDAAGNSTSISYDTLGRKTGMRDPDMGAWAYGYDVNGNLTQQTDAKGQSATFTYDALNRQTGATYPDQRVMAWAYDEAVPNGRGQRTSSAVWEAGIGKLYMVWHYDARGNQSLQRHNLPGGITRDFSRIYDSADRLVQLIYPPLGGVTETLTYSYDAGWRQTSVCTSRGGCYASGAKYSALDQPKQWTFGNGLQQTWVYDSPMQRLNAILLGTSSNVASQAFFTYGPYDGVGNLKAVLDRFAAQTQTFTYDHRDRLSSATTQGGVIRVSARGDYAGGAWPEMEVWVNGALVRTFTVSSASLTTYSVDTGVPLQPSDKIDVVFTNDYYDGTSDRNLYVDWVVIGEQTVQAESGSVIYDTGVGSAAFDGLDTIPGREMMSGYGALRFQAGKEITVRARGDYAGGGWPVMDVRVNGTVVQSFTVGSGSWADYRVVLSTPLALDDQVDVAYTNDYSDSTSDRNLSVDSVQMAGQSLRPQSDAVTYDTGAGAAAFDGQGVYPGLRQPHSGGLMAWYGALRMRARMSYTYDQVGNLTSNAGLPLSYPAGGASSVRPHAPTAVGGFSYSYDANGNMLSGVSQSLTWTAQNLPASITGPDGVAETYGYDDGGERLTRTRGGQTTFYLGGLWEEIIGGSTKATYTFNGAVVAQRDSSAGVTYLHGDSLGSVSIASDAAGAVVSRQSFTPWGAVRSGGIGQTSYNYTGQRLDQTGLLYYHARMYDPVIGRFLSPDSVVPSNASGSMDGVALKPLTVDFHEPGFVSALNGENRQPFWFQMSDKQRQKVGDPWGPANPQALNRYSYVQNNPLKWIDPTGHVIYDRQQAEQMYRFIRDTALPQLGSLVGMRSTATNMSTMPLELIPFAGGLVREVYQVAISDGSSFEELSFDALSWMKNRLEDFRTDWSAFGKPYDQIEFYYYADGDNIYLLSRVHNSETGAWEHYAGSDGRIGVQVTWTFVDNLSIIGGVSGAIPPKPVPGAYPVR